MIIEICADSVQSALNASNGGASRIELCHSLEVGGTTPSRAAIHYCCTHLPLQTFVLIRPRSGNFCYSETELEVIKQDILECKKIGAQGVVVGFLNADFTLNVKITDEMVRLAYPMEVTFHRAFDCCLNPFDALEQIVNCGCARILTSGFCHSAEQGIDNLKKLVNIADNRIVIMAGAGITPQNALLIASQSGVGEIHSSCKKIISKEIIIPDYLKNNIVNMEYTETDTETVRELINLF